jgi:hypothetical protein
VELDDVLRAGLEVKVVDVLSDEALEVAVLLRCGAAKEAAVGRVFARPPLVLQARQDFVRLVGPRFPEVVIEDLPEDGP